MKNPRSLLHIKIRQDIRTTHVFSHLSESLTGSPFLLNFVLFGISYSFHLFSIFTIFFLSSFFSFSAIPLYLFILFSILCSLYYLVLSVLSACVEPFSALCSSLLCSFSGFVCPDSPLSVLVAFSCLSSTVSPLFSAP